MSRAASGTDRVPFGDLLAVLAATTLALFAVALPPATWHPLTALVGICFVLLVPGYAIVAATFPRRGDLAPRPVGGHSWIGRLCLSVGASVVAVAIVGLLLDVTVIGVTRLAVIGGLSVVSVLATAVAWYRRQRLPPAIRAGASVAGIQSRTRSILLAGGTLEVVLTIVTILAVAGAVGVVAQEPQATGSVTSFSFVGLDDTDDVTAGEYDGSFTVGESARAAVAVGASDDAAFEGSVVVRLERVSTVDGSVRIREFVKLDEFSVTVPAGSSIVYRHTFEPSIPGERLRLTYRLYAEDRDTPVHRVQYWITVAPEN